MRVPFQQSISFKQGNANFQDRESQSTAESYSELLTIGSDIQPSHKDGNAKDKKSVDRQVESAASTISQDLMISAQMGYKQQQQHHQQQPLVSVPFPNAEPYSGGFMQTHGSHSIIPHMGSSNSRVLLPFDPFRNEPMYVNSKQYHGILRRRQQRAKLEAQNKLAKDRKSEGLEGLVEDLSLQRSFMNPNPMKVEAAQPQALMPPMALKSCSPIPISGSLTMLSGIRNGHSD